MASRRTQGWSLSTALLLSPWLATWLAFTALPVAWSFYLSFTPYSLLNPRYDWEGLKNYASLLRSPFFWQTFVNTAVYTAGVVPLTVLLALAAALLVQNPKRGGGVLQASYFLPGVVSVIVLAVVFKSLYAPDGMLDQIVHALGFQPPKPPWLLNPRWALACVMGMSVWASFGFFMLLYVAAIRSIPEELYEAAALDGATGWSLLWSITLPQLRPTTLLIIVLCTINSLQVYPEIFVLTDGGPLGATTTSVYYLWTLAFEDFHLGKASALSYMLTAFILGIVVVQMRLFSFHRGVGE